MNPLSTGRADANGTLLAQASRIFYSTATEPPIFHHHGHQHRRNAKLGRCGGDLTERANIVSGPPSCSSALSHLSLDEKR